VETARTEVRRLGALQLALALPVAAVAAAALALAPGRLELGTASPHSLQFLGLTIAYPGANLAALLLLTLALAGALATVRAGRLLIAQLAAQRRLLRSLELVGVLPQTGARVFRDPRPQAFCAGLLRPHAYVSTGALGVLESDELEAVLAHEAEHRRARDPLRLLAADLAARSLAPLPLYGRIARRLATAAELSADGAALGVSGGDRRPLAGALIVMSEAAHGAVAVDPERVDALSGAPAPAWRVPRALALATLAAAALTAYILWRAAGHAHLRASLALPGLSAKPCVLALALVPLAVLALARAADPR